MVTSRFLPITVWVLGYFVGVYLAGFWVATPLFVGGYMKTHGSTWRQTLLTTVIFSIVFFTVFNAVLKVDLYPGRLMMAMDLLAS